MLLSEVVNRLEELRRVESDIHLLVQNEKGVPVEEFTFDTFTDDNGIRRVMLFPAENSTEGSVQEELQLDLDPSVQQEEEAVFEEQPLRETVHERRTRQARERTKE